MNDQLDTTLEPPKPVLIGSDRPQNPRVGMVSFITSLIAPIFLIASFVTMYGFQHLFETESAYHKRVGEFFTWFLFFEILAITTGIVSRKTRRGKFGLAFSLIVSALLALFFVVNITIFGAGTE
jgi:phosphate starvation-inducible membrane PsiE